MQNNIIIKNLGYAEYATTLTAMQQFTQARTHSTHDELWLTEHPPVYTLGLNKKGVRLPINDIPVVNVDRGGKITYHGPGQVVIYTLIDLKRQGLNVRQLVTILETSLINWLSKYGISAVAKKDAPGVYVNDAKIASLGLRLKNQCCYHGLSLNVDMDLSPFTAIDPCGYAGMAMTQTKDLGITLDTATIGEELINQLKASLIAWPVKTA